MLASVLQKAGEVGSELLVGDRSIASARFVNTCSWRKKMANYVWEINLIRFLLHRTS